MFYKVFLLISMMFMSLGFRIRLNQNWDLKETDPVIWVKLCPTEDLTMFFGEEDFKGDTLCCGDKNLGEILQSVMIDYNSIPTSYLKLESFPADPDNPPATSTFTVDKAAIRTIDICFGSLGGTQGGGADPDLGSSFINGCEITIERDSNNKPKELIGVLTHEIGHCFRLGHPQETTRSVMSYYRGENVFRLQRDDKMGITYSFPKASDDGSYSEVPNFGLRCDPK